MSLPANGCSKVGNLNKPLPSVLPKPLFLFGRCSHALTKKTRNNSHSFKYHSLCKRDDLHLPMSTRCQALDCSGDSVTAPGMQRKSRTSGDGKRRQKDLRVPLPVQSTPPMSALVYDLTVLELPHTVGLLTFSVN